MARRVPELEPLAAQAGFGQIRTGEAPPWLRYVHAIKDREHRLNMLIAGTARTIFDET
jgi:hypothetical protein